MKFEQYHPTINLIYFIATIVCTILFHHPVFLAISYAAAFVYSVKRGKRKVLIFDLVLIPLIVLWTLWYASYHHFGITVLGVNAVGNDITLESVVFGLVTGVTMAAVLMWILCIFIIFSSDKVVYLFGRISPKLSLFLSVLFRGLPRVRQAAWRISVSQRGIGRGARQGNPGQMLLHLIRILSITITWMLESFVSASESMRCRGYSLKGRSAYSIYRFDNRDRSVVIILFAALIVTVMAAALDQTNILYDPQIVMNRVTPASVVFYVVYAFLLLMPAGLEVIAAAKFNRQRKAVEQANQEQRLGKVSL